MTEIWPSFVTKDLKDSDEAEWLRRWNAYDRDMRALIATGRFHQDEDGWWVETSTGKLVGPDPEIERPRTDEELRGMRPLKVALPELHAAIRRARGRPRIDNAKAAVTLRIDPDTLARFKATGKDWRARMAKALDSASSK